MIKPISLAEIPQTCQHRGKNIRITDIEKFLASGADAAEVLLDEGENPNSVTSSLQTAIRNRKHYSDMCYVIRRSGRVFLVRWPDKRTGK